jgi:hypothetical protein
MHPGFKYLRHCVQVVNLELGAKKNTFVRIQS